MLAPRRKARARNGKGRSDAFALERFTPAAAVLHL